MKRLISLVFVVSIVVIFSYSGITQETWRTVSSWQGKSTKNTETFRILASEWRVCWKTQGDGILQIYIHDSDKNLKDLAANVQGNDEDCSIMRGAGNYYLSINTTQVYNIIVEERYIRAEEMKLSPPRKFHLLEAEKLLKDKGYENIQAHIIEDNNIIDFYFEIKDVSKDEFLNVVKVCSDIAGEITNEKSPKLEDKPDPYHQTIIWATSRVIFTENGERIAFLYAKDCCDALKIKDDEGRRNYIESKLKTVK